MVNLMKQYEMDIQSLKLIPSDGGTFEIQVGDRLVYSKLKSGRHSEEGEVERLVGEALKT
jgi:selenoprotein W-related protein